MHIARSTHVQDLLVVESRSLVRHHEVGELILVAARAML